jgi:hypothetical protein
VVEHPWRGVVAAARHVGAGLFIKAPWRQTDLPGDRYGLIEDYAMWLEDRVDVAVERRPS